MQGWICPICGKGKSPWVQECDCVVTPSFFYSPTTWPYFSPDSAGSPLPEKPKTTCSTPIEKG